MPKVILNAGHGGSDQGEMYNNRREKNDNLRLALAISDILKSHNVEVSYPRENNSFVSPVIRALNINQENADLLVNIHRGAGPSPNTSTGARAFIYRVNGINVEASENVLKNLERIGFRNNGWSMRDIYILRYTDVPSFEIIVGYINNDADNELFDARFYDIANMMAAGILDALNIR